MTIKAIIFDLDNTLIDFLRFKRVCCEAAVEAMLKAGLKLSKKKAVEDIYRIYDVYGMEDGIVFQRFLKKEFGKVDYHKLAVAITAYRKARVLKPYPGANSTLKHLKKKGLKLAVVTDAPKLKAWLRLTAMGMDNLFDTVATRTGKQKPFKAAMKQLKVKPENTLVVGDHPTRDIKAAKALGMKTCLAKYGTKTKAEADYEINSIEELKRLI